MPDHPAHPVPPAHGTGAYWYARRPVPDPDKLTCGAENLVRVRGLEAELAELRERMQVTQAENRRVHDHLEFQEGQIQRLSRAARLALACLMSPSADPEPVVRELQRVLERED